MYLNMQRVALNTLGADELKRRIEAARILRGIEQTDLDALFDQDGLGKSASRMERGKLPLTRARLDGLVRHLRVPEDWFTVRDVDSLVFPDGAPESTPGRLSEIEQQLRVLRGENEARASEVRQQISEALRPILARSQRPG